MRNILKDKLIKLMQDVRVNYYKNNQDFLTEFTTLLEVIHSPHQSLPGERQVAIEYLESRADSLIS
jgi:ABC-type Zn uptake system ZnuABC Zn-binding protein ZnuA